VFINFSNVKIQGVSIFEDYYEGLETVLVKSFIQFSFC